MTPMKKSPINALLITIALLILLMAGLRLLISHRFPPSERSTVVRDTVVDTIRLTIPVAKDSTVVRHRFIRVPIRMDTLSRNEQQDSIIQAPTPDSAFVSLPIRQKVYEDSLYRAYVSGYEAQLDSIHLFPKTVTVTHTTTTTKPPRRWTVGVQGGVGITPKGVLPYVGVGASFTIF